MANVYGVIEDLENSKANARKKAVDALPTLLDEPAKRNQLSDASWVGLVKKSIESAKLDVNAAKKTRRAPRREVGDLVERITSWCADGPSGRRLAGCAEDLLNFSSAAYGEAGEVWCISYGRVLERLLGEPEAIEAAAINFAGRNLDGRQAARRICAPAARIARGRFPDPAPPPHERAGARKAAAAALRRLAERGADALVLDQGEVLAALRREDWPLVAIEALLEALADPELVEQGGAAEREARRRGQEGAGERPRGNQKFTSTRPS